MLWHAMAYDGMSCDGMAWRGMVWHCMAWHGMALHAMAYDGMRWHAVACNDVRWQGLHVCVCVYVCVPLNSQDLLTKMMPVRMPSTPRICLQK